MKRTTTFLLLTAITVFLSSAGFSQQPAESTSNASTPLPLTDVHTVLLVTIDGVRYQEVFGGADRSLLDGLEGGERKSAEDAFWADNAEERRGRLMPFLWSLVNDGQATLFGDPDAGSPNRVTNGKNFSYPGYSELLVGYSDDRIESNDKISNPNESVLEWLNVQEELKGRVAVLGSWDVFPSILRSDRNNLFVNAGWEKLELPIETPKVKALNYLTERTFREWDYLRNDAFTALATQLTFEQIRPRVLYVALGEPDDWAHQGRYERYLRTTRDADKLIEELWQMVQEDPYAKGKTALVITTDHGRGEGPKWTGHGSTIKFSDRGWIAVVSPIHSAGGIARDQPTTLAQTAATVARLLGYDYEAHNGAVAKSLPLER